VFFSVLDYKPKNFCAVLLVLNQCNAASWKKVAVVLLAWFESNKQHAVCLLQRRPLCILGRSILGWVYTSLCLPPEHLTRLLADCVVANARIKFMVCTQANHVQVAHSLMYGEQLGITKHLCAYATVASSAWATTYRLNNCEYDIIWRYHERKTA